MDLKRVKEVVIGLGLGVLGLSALLGGVIDLFVVVWEEPFPMNLVFLLLGVVGLFLGPMYLLISFVLLFESDD